MSWVSYSLPIDLPPVIFPTVAPPSPDESPVTVIVPVKDDLGGLLKTLYCLDKLRPAPCNIIVVDDGSETPVSKADCLLVARSLAGRTRLIRHPKNRGAAAARNAGLSKIRAAQWVYFTDCGCEPTPDVFSHFAQLARREKRNFVAFAGPVIGEGHGIISRYMTLQGILNPPFCDGSPQAIVTANALVWAPAARLIGGFDRRFPGAGGEDIDFGLRLRSLGEIGWCETAVVRHRFVEDLADFDNRFRRYGRGTRLLGLKWRRSLIPQAFTAVTPELQPLADLHVRAMLEGYDPDGSSKAAGQGGRATDSTLSHPLAKFGEASLPGPKGAATDEFASLLSRPEK